MMSAKSKTKIIMIVDDDEDLLFVLSSQLKKEGFKVFINLGGNDLIEILKKQKTDIVLLDLSMHMINGRELCRQIKSNGEFTATKVIIMSGNHDIEKAASECDADGYVTKPLSLQEVISTLERYI